MNELDKIVNSLMSDVDSKIILRTSGTTGAPKQVSKNVSEMFDKAKQVEYKKDDTFGFFYNLDSWAAMSVIVHCIKNGVKPLYIHIDGDVLHQLSKVSHLSITPTLLQLIAMKSENIAISNIKKVVLGGEYSTQKILDLCKLTFPNADITHIYSSTETGDIASSSDLKEGYKKEKFDSYEFDKNNCLLVNNINTGDIWSLQGNRYYFKGRIDRSIKIAGNLVLLDAIENAISNLGFINECSCIEKDAPLIGKSYELQYVGDKSIEYVKAELSKVLNKYEMPIRITKVTEIGLGRNYKKRAQ